MGMHKYYLELLETEQAKKAPQPEPEPPEPEPEPPEPEKPEDEVAAEIYTYIWGDDD